MIYTPPDPEGTWIQTQSGRAFDLDNPQPEQVNIYDIGWHLSGIERFTGASEGWSVAMHSLLVEALVRKSLSPDGPGGGVTKDEACLAALLHDAAEAYVGDVTAPMKRLMRLRSRVGHQPLDLVESAFDRVEQEVQSVIADRFGLHYWIFDTDYIKQADLWALAMEKRSFFHKEARPWGEIDETDSPGKGERITDEFLESLGIGLPDLRGRWDEKMSIVNLARDLLGGELP